MARAFRNPANNHVEEVSAATWILALLFGVIYQLVKGLWAHAAIQFLLGFVFLGAFGPPGVMFVVAMWIIYAIVTPMLLANRYLRDGWVEVGFGESANANVPGAMQQPIKDNARMAADEKTCPYCAEVIKKAAIKCKHCGADLSTPPA